jgi:hypothetical protein
LVHCTCLLQFRTCCFDGVSRPSGEVSRHRGLVSTPTRGDEPRATSTGMFKTSSAASRWTDDAGCSSPWCVHPHRIGNQKAFLLLLLQPAVRDERPRATGGVLVLMQYATCPRGKYSSGLKSDQSSQGGGALALHTEQCLQLLHNAMVHPGEHRVLSVSQGNVQIFRPPAW